MRRLPLTVFAVASLVALGQVPGKLGYQGRLLRADGAPESGVVSMTFAVFDAATGGAAQGCDSLQVALSDGFYSVHLGGAGGCAGGGPGIAPSAFDGRDLYLEIGVAGVQLSPRQRIVSVPYAYRAATAYDVRGGTVEATTVTIGGGSGVLIAANGITVGTATAVDASGKATVAIGAGLAGNGSSSTPLSVAANGVTNSMLASDAASLAKVSAGAVSAVASDVGVGTASPAAKLDVAGGVRVGADTGPCSATRAGTLRWNATARALEVCGGTAWITVANVRDGSVQAGAGRSCKDLLANGVTADGTNWIDPNGGGTADAYPVRCDMTTNGGGWTELARFSSATVNIVASTYTAGLGAITDADYVVPCNRFGGLDLFNTVMRVSMGDVRDFFRPTAGNDVCAMLQSFTRHQWSPTATGTFVTPTYYSTHLGGSATSWPQDGRSYLSFWGGGGAVSGCCHYRSSIYNPPADSPAAWNRAFALHLREP